MQQGIIFQIQNRIPDLAMLLVIVVATGSFILSYTNLSEAAVRAGIPKELSPIFPVTVDAFLAIGTLTVLRANLWNESSVKGWLTLATFTLISIALNVAVSTLDPLSIVCHALAPVALAVSLELFTGFVRSDISRSRPVPMEQQKVVSETCEDSADVLPEKENNPQTVVERRRSADVDDQEILDLLISEPGISISRVSEVLRLHKSTTSRRMKRLQDQGMIPIFPIAVYQQSSAMEYRNEPVEPVH